YVRLITGMPVTDPTSGFKCYNRAVLESIDIETLQSNGYSFQIETIHRAWRRGFVIREIPITFEDRQVGASKMSGLIVHEALGMVWKLLIRAGFRRRSGHRNPASVVRGEEAR
ncbi:MAG: polyprenol monophosphomannose synthase, partial [Kiritimatiellia bacterium]|nr:polyprenol monophosphomannose synthase [Kiritimatiellia bacterium]